MNREKIFKFVFIICNKAITEVLKKKSNQIMSIFEGYVNYPVLSFNENGFPTIFKSPYGHDKVIDYEKYFMINKHFDKDKVNIEIYPEYIELKEFLLTCDKFIKVYGLGEDPNELVEHAIKKNIIDLIAKVLVEYGENNVLTREQLYKFYQPIENRIILDYLPMNFYIPILFTKFETKEFELTDTISIVEMNELFQKSRAEIESYHEGIPNQVLMSATHAIRITNYSTSNLNYWESSHLFNNYDNYPINLIKTFFNSLHISGILSGYAQIIAHPVGWVDQYKADLLDLKGIALRQYPIIFNNYYWSKSDFPTVDNSVLSNVQTLFSFLINTPNKKVNLALSRLENSYFRNNEGDRIIDLVIGLESLLSDGEKTELTHKLSLRTAFLLQNSSMNKSKLEIFQDMKLIYNYRSAIVHGENSDKLEKKKYIYYKGEKVLVVEVAEAYLKECIKTLIHHPQFLNAKQIDEVLILSD